MSDSNVVPAPTTRHKKYAWGTLYLRVRMDEASHYIRYSTDGGVSFDETPFSVATAHHSWPTAFLLVNRWLKGQAG